MVSVGESSRIFSLFGEIETRIEKSIGSKDIDDARTLIQEAQTMVSSNSHQLPARDLQNYKGRIDALKKKFDDAKAPRKKFGFSKAAKGANQAAAEAAPKIDPPLEGSKKETIQNRGAVSFLLTGKSGESLLLENVSGDVELSKLSKCKVRITGNAASLYISDVLDSEIVMDPVTNSVLIVGFDRSTLMTACQQMRIHKANGSRLYLHVTSRSIIEDCHNMEFAPLKDYPASEEVWRSSGLQNTKNNYSAVDDFNWLSDEPSPNFKIVDE